MLSASTINTSHSSAFSATNSTISTPFSQYSADSAKNGNPLTELVETERSFIENLKIIDRQIAPIWMKQMTSAAPEFSELLKLIHDILKVNKQFCTKLTNISGNPQMMKELGNILMQWVDDMEVPYANYFRSFIPNLNTRNDIAKIQAIQNILQGLSAKVPYEITLESLFNAPIQQLKYYKGLYSRLLDSTEPGKDDYKLLSRANRRIDTIQMMLSKSANSGSSFYHTLQPTSSASSARPPSINTNFELLNNSSHALTDFATFVRQVDCSRTVDLFTGAKVNYELPTAYSGTQILKRDNFVMMQDNGKNTAPTRVHLILTEECLIICRECANTFFLMFPAIFNDDIIVKADLLERELVGEYILALSVVERKQLTLRADSREIRNMWVGESKDASKMDLMNNSRSLTAVAQQHLPASTNTSNERKINANGIKNTDMFTYYSESGAVSPLESSDEEEEVDSSLLKQSSGGYKNSDGRNNAPRDTIMDIYNNHLFGESTTRENDEPMPEGLIPQTVKILPQIPNVSQLEVQSLDDITASRSPSPNKGTFNVAAEKTSVRAGHKTPVDEESVTTKGSSHVQLMYINAPTAQISTMSISPPVEQPNELYQPSSSSSSSAALPTPPTTNSTASSSSSSFASSSPPSTSEHLSPINSSYSQKVEMSPQIQHSNNRIGPITQASSNNRGATGGKINDNSNKPSSPSSPMTVNIQTVASVPVAMQAVTQKKDEFLSKTQQQKKYQPVANQQHIHPSPPAPSTNANGLMSQRNDSIRQQPHPVIPRSSSIKGTPPQPRPMYNSNNQNNANQFAAATFRPYMQNHPHQLGHLKPLPHQPSSTTPNVGQQEYQNRPLPPVSGNRPQGPQGPQGPQPQLQRPQYVPPSPSPSLITSTHQQTQGYSNPLGPGRPFNGGQQPNTPRPPLNGSNSPIPTHYQHQQSRQPSNTNNNNNYHSMQELNSPPHSPNMLNSAKYIRQILYSNNQCEVFHWNNQSWYAVEGQCELQIKLTHTNRTCLTVQLQPNNQLYLNAWIMPTTIIRQPSPTDVNISLYLGTKKENYLIHFPQPQEANTLARTLYKAHQDSIALQQLEMAKQAEAEANAEPDLPEPVDTVNVPQILKPLMQCKAKLFVKNETANWSTLGSVTMRISQQSPSLRMLIQIENDKTKLVSAIVRSGNVERINSKRISFLLTDDSSKTSIVYLIHLREDQTGNKIYEYLRTKNADNGW